MNVTHKENTKAVDINRYTKQLSQFDQHTQKSLSDAQKLIEEFEAREFDSILIGVAYHIRDVMDSALSEIERFIVDAIYPKNLRARRVIQAQADQEAAFVCGTLIETAKHAMSNGIPKDVSNDLYLALSCFDPRKGKSDPMTEEGQVKILAHTRFFKNDHVSRLMHRGLT